MGTEVDAVVAADVDAEDAVEEVAAVLPVVAADEAAVVVAAAGVVVAGFSITPVKYGSTVSFTEIFELTVHVHKLSVGALDAAKIETIIHIHIT